MTLGDGEATGGTPGVMQGGNDGQERGRIEGQGPQHNQRHGSIDLANKNREERQNLGAGAGLAVDAGAEVAHTETDVEKSGNDQNAQVTAENQDGDASRHQPLVHEDQEQGAEHQLVGDGIEVLANLGMLLEDPCGEAVEAIAEAAYDKEAKRGSVVRLQNCDDKKGY